MVAPCLFSETICSGIASHFISFCVLVAPSVKCHRSNHLETHQSIDRYLARTLNTEATEDSNRSVWLFFSSHCCFSFWCWHSARTRCFLSCSLWSNIFHRKLECQGLRVVASWLTSDVFTRQRRHFLNIAAWSDLFKDHFVDMQRLCEVKVILQSRWHGEELLGPSSTMAPSSSPSVWIEGPGGTRALACLVRVVQLSAQLLCKLPNLVSSWRLFSGQSPDVVPAHGWSWAGALGRTLQLEPSHFWALDFWGWRRILRCLASNACRFQACDQMLGASPVTTFPPPTLEVNALMTCSGHSMPLW